MLAVLKNDVPGFTIIRRLAIRFQSVLRHHKEKKLEEWLDDAKSCGVPAVANFARTLMIDIQAVRNAVIESWSNGQTEGYGAAQGQNAADWTNRRSPSLRMTRPWSNVTQGIPAAQLATNGHCHINFEPAAFGRKQQRPMIYAASRMYVSCRHTSKASDLIDR